MFAARAAFMAGKKAGLKGSISLTRPSSISTTSASAFAMGTSDWTIELWYYRTANNGNEYLFDLGSNGTRIQLASGTLYFAIQGSAGYVTSSSGFDLNTWNHIAITKTASSGGISGYINGNYVGFTSNTYTMTETSCRIGDYGGGGYSISGFISNFRIVKETAIYTSSFTPPSSSLTAVSGTSILACQDPTVIKDNGPNAFSMTVNGSAAASSVSPFA